LSHIAAGAGRARQAVSEPTDGWQSITSQSTGTLDARAADPTS
jgi:hypothetical protein